MKYQKYKTYKVFDSTDMPDDISEAVQEKYKYRLNQDVFLKVTLYKPQPPCDDADPYDKDMHLLELKIYNYLIQSGGNENEEVAIHFWW
jgi:hypothetical protein